MEILGDYIRIRTGRLDANAATADGEYPFFTCAKETSRINDWAFDCECVLVAGNRTPHVSYYKGKFNAYQRVYVIESTDQCRLSTKYLYYFLKEYMALAVDRQHGAIEKFFCLSDFTEIKMSLPDLPTQLRIAGVLGSIDEKIELNRKKIAELEALAKTIYDYWFVQFDFPDANGKPYRSSGGKMVWNEQLKREIPAGWCNGKLSDIAYYASDKIQSNAIPLENYVTTDSMLQNKQGRDIATSLPPPGTSIVCFRESDTLVANIRPYLQKIWFSNVQGGCSQDVLVFRAKKSCVPTFLYSTLWQDNFFDYVMTGAKGSKMPRGDKDHIMSYPLALPVESLLSQYNKIVGDFWSRRNFALQQITELTALRDLLLPLLMNGQVVVK